MSCPRASQRRQRPFPGRPSPGLGTGLQGQVEDGIAAVALEGEPHRSQGIAKDVRSDGRGQGEPGEGEGALDLPLPSSGREHEQHRVWALMHASDELVSSDLELQAAVVLGSPVVLEEERDLAALTGDPADPVRPDRVAPLVGGPAFPDPGEPPPPAGGRRGPGGRTPRCTPPGGGAWGLPPRRRSGPS